MAVLDLSRGQILRRLRWPMAYAIGDVLSDLARSAARRLAWPAGIVASLAFGWMNGRSLTIQLAWAVLS